MAIMARKSAGHRHKPFTQFDAAGNGVYAQLMGQSERASYWIIFALLGMVIVLHLGSFVLTILFGYFALELFSFGRHRRMGFAIYVVAVAAVALGAVYFSRQVYVALPRIADSTIPAVVGFAEKHAIELPFSDYESLKTVALDEAKEGLAGIGRSVRAASFQFVLLITGLVVAASLFLNQSRAAPDAEADSTKNNLYVTLARQTAERLNTLYGSFKKMIGAQVLISTINTALTAIFLLWNSYPFAVVLIVLTFLFGLLPIIGNLLSNTLIVGVAFTISPKLALAALVFLILIHKLEYFLNSKIIGHRIKTPMWLTLVGLVVGEKLMGIPGMILAPALLHYIRIETSRFKAVAAKTESVEPPAESP